MPGGHIFIPLQLLLSTRNESELSGVLAHAIAHIARRHGTRSATAAKIDGVTQIPLIYIGGLGHSQPRHVPIGFRKYQLEYEAEADRLAGEWMSKAGSSPAHFADYLLREQPQSLLPLEERADALRAIAPPSSPTETGNFAAALARARVLNH